MPLRPGAPLQSSLARSYPRTFLGVYTTIGFTIAAGCAWAFFAIADEFPEHGWLTRSDVFVANWLQLHGTQTGEAICSAISYLGGAGLTALVLAASISMAWRRDWRLLLALAITCGGAALLNAALKEEFRRARPSFASEFTLSSWSFPSAHAMNSLVTYGFLAAWVIALRPNFRIPAIAVTVALVVAIGFARIYLGVHYLSDVIAGYSAGTVWLLVCTSGLRFVEDRRRATREAGA
jgi:membrane-associated phospholipid phosphatase